MKMYEKRTASDVELELRPSVQQPCFSDTLKKEGSGQRGTVTQNERQNCKYKQQNGKHTIDVRYVIQVEIQRGQRSKVKMQNAVQLTNKVVRKHTDHWRCRSTANCTLHAQRGQNQRKTHDVRPSEKQTTSTPKCKINSSQEEHMILCGPPSYCTQKKASSLSE